jgi:endonuclease/exonuclease/phosphatase family metal-dependent hydrolase
MLRILTLNVQQYAERNGTWAQRLPLLVDSINAVDADLVALQAVARAPGRCAGMDQAAQLAARLPQYPIVLYAAAPHREGKLGVALLCRHAPHDHAAVPLTLLPGLEDDQERVALSARFELPDTSVQLLVGHFSWVPEQCLLNVDEALAHLAGRSGWQLLLGDFNASPDSPAMRKVAAAGFVDQWPLLNPDDPGDTFEAVAPRLRIDYVWSSPSAYRLRTIMTAARPRAGSAISPSDHLGLLATFG